MQIFPESLMKLWNEWQLRIMILLSLSIQIVLIIFGTRRRNTSNNWVRILVWMTYLAADWAATVSLGILSNNLGDSVDTFPHAQSAITTFWAPFLLLHLGGPDSITAYSLEDNELWLRQLLGLCFQVGVTFYVFLKSWTGANLMFSFLSIPLFIAGIIKYGERTWALRSASSNYFRDSLLPAPDPGPDYATFMEEYSLRISQGYNVHYGGVIEPMRQFNAGRGILFDAIYLHEAHFFV